jgi:clan AA aspartic protease
VGLTYIDVDIANPAKPRRVLRLTLLVDSGAVYSVVPASILRKLGVKPHSRRSFILADVTKITRRIGDLSFRLHGQQGTSPVIFGEKDDSVLLGSVSLEALGLMLDPLKRQLRPLPMVLAVTTPWMRARSSRRDGVAPPRARGRGWL